MFRLSLLPIWAIIDRDLRKYFRSPVLLSGSLVLPLLQLFILGYAFGGNIKGVSVAVVDLDRGAAALALREKFQAIEANAKTFRVHFEDNLERALRDTRDGTVSATIVIPLEYSRKVKQQNRPGFGLVLDNTDPFVVSTLTQKLNELLLAVNETEVSPRYWRHVTLEVVEIFPYVEYIQYLLPGSITLGIFACALIGGGLLYIDDKARGFHEGYLVSPISRLQLVLGMNLAGTLKATLSGVVVTLAGALIVGVADLLTPTTVVLLLLLNLLVASSLINLIFLLMVRVDDPVIPRAMFAILNTLLFFPSGAMYPIYSFPPWLQFVAAVNPFAYAVHGFRALLLKNVGASAIMGDIAFLSGFSLVCFLGVVSLFRRRL